MKRRGLILLFIALFAIPALGAEKKTPVKIGYTPAIASLPLFVAMEKGFFAQAGLAAEPVAFATAEAALDALKYNDVEAVAGAPFWAYLKLEDAEPGELRIFLPAHESPDEPASFLLVKPGSPLKGIDDLKRKSVGTYQSEFQENNLRTLLEEAGFKPGEDIFIKTVPAARQLEALRTGDIDALFTIEPYAAVAQTRGAGRVLAAGVRPRYLGNPFWTTAAAFSARYLRTDAETAAKIYRALKDAVLFIRTHPAEAKAAMANYLLIDAQSAQKCGIYRWTLLTEEADFAQLRVTATKMHADGFLKKKPNPAALFLKPEQLTP